MSRGRVAIVVLVGLGVLFVLGIGATAMRGERQGAALERQQDGYRKGWVGAIDGLTQRFSPKLDRSRLQVLSPGSQCRRLDDIIEIEAGAGCEVEIARQAPACGDDHQVAGLRVLSADSRARRTAATAGAVDVIYRARFNGGEKLEQKSVGADEMRLVVMPAGGRLMLRCRGGCEGRPLRLALNGRPSCR